MALSNTNLTDIQLWKSCHGCGAAPIIGARFECQDCPLGPDIDFCDDCYQLYLNDKLEHPNRELSVQAGAIATPNRKHTFIEKIGTLYSVAGLDKWLKTPLLGHKSPSLQHSFVVRPVITAGRDCVLGSCAFAIEYNDELFALTALHVLDELIKKRNIKTTENEFSGEELPAIISEVDLYDVFATNWMTTRLGQASKMVVLPDSRLHEEEPKSDNDIAAFKVTDVGALKPARLAKQVPGVGENIWLVFIDNKIKRGRLYPAVVVETSDDRFIFKFDSGVKVPKGSSGAPLINAAGEVVAISVGGGCYMGYEFGHGNHVNNICRHLDNVRIEL